MHLRIRGLDLGIALIFAAAASVVAPAQEMKDPLLKDPLIGTWALNHQKSAYPGAAPKSITRTFDYTRDGLILVAYETVNAKGIRSFTHWYLGLDGKEHPEFSRATGPTRIFYLSAKVVDPYTKEVTDRRVAGGIIMITIAVSKTARR